MTDADSVAADGRKPKRQASEKQLAALARGRAARQRKLEEKERQRAEAPEDSSPAPEPDAPDEVQQNGQKLVRVARRSNGSSMSSATSERTESETEEFDEPEQEPDEEEEEYPSVEAVARQTKLVGNDDADLFDEEPDVAEPEQRKQPTFEVPDLQGTDFQPRSLDDLMAMAPIGDGQYRINVKRTSPKKYNGVQCAGEQAPITRGMDYRQFIETYGGGEYELRLYGPPKRGGVIDPITRRVRPKPLSAPCKYIVPLDVAAPILHFEDEGYEDMTSPMRYGHPLGVRPAGPADAKIHQVDREYEERQQDRQERREREREERERKLELEAERRGISVAEMIATQKEQEIRRTQQHFEQLLENQREQHEKEVAMLRQQFDEAQKRKSPTGDIAELVRALSPDKGERLQEIMAQSQRELERITKSHETEMARQSDRLREVQQIADERIREATERAERQARDANERAERIVKVTEDRTAEQIRDQRANYEQRTRELMDATEKRVREVEERARRDIEDQRAQAQQRIADEQRNHDRELRAKDESWTMRLQTQESTLKAQIAAKEDEVNRLRAENSRLQAEADKDLGERLQNFSSLAETLGYERSGEEAQDWQTKLVDLGVTMAQVLPETIKQLGEARRPQLPFVPQPRALPAPNPQMAPSYPPPSSGWATDDGPEYEDDDAGPVEPRYPVGYEPRPVAPVPHPPQQPAPQAAPPQPAPHPQQQPPQAAPPQQAAQPRPASAGGLGVQQIAQIKPILEEAITEGASPEEFAQQFSNAVPPEAVTSMLATTSVAQIVTLVQSLPGGSQSPIVRREGQKFLKEVWARLAAMQQ